MPKRTPDEVARDLEHAATIALNEAWNERWNYRAAYRRAVNGPWPTKPNPDDPIDPTAS